MRRGFRQILRFLAALLLLFAPVALARATARLGWAAGFWRMTPTLLGLLGAVAVFCLGFRWRLVYVFGHELTHWLAAKICRRRTGVFRFTRDGGYVAVDRPNLFITLSPYFVPLYSLVWIGLYGIYLAFAGMPSRGMEFTFAVGLGMTYGFHVAATVWVLSMGQQDLLHGGRLLSWAVILFGNAAILFLAVMVASGRWAGGMALFGACLRHQFRFLVQLVVFCWQTLAGLLQRAN